MKEIRYKIKDSNGLHEVIFTAPNFPNHEKNVLSFLKKFHEDQYRNTKKRINEQIASYEKNNRWKMESEHRESIINEFCFYDKDSIEVLSINGVAVDEIIERRLIYKLTALSGDAVGTLVLDFKSLTDSQKQEFLNKIK